MDSGGEDPFLKQLYGGYMETMPSTALLLH